MQQEIWIAWGGGAAFLEEMNDAGEDSTGMDAFANLREEIALQIEEIADQLVGVGGDREFALFEIGETGFDREAGGVLTQLTDGDGGRIDGGDVPAQAGEVEGVASGTAGEVECAGGWEHLDGLNQ